MKVKTTESKVLLFATVLGFIIVTLAVMFVHPRLVGWYGMIFIMFLVGVLKYGWIEIKKNKSRDNQIN